jgi:hypothetical protein
MSTENKSHFRKVYKSDHLGVADLEDLIDEGKSLIFTITHVKQEDTLVAGKKGTFNIAYFKEKIKPWVLNATNAKVVKSFAGTGSPFVEDWKNVPVELYVDNNVKMKGEVVGGVRIKPIKPTIAKEKPVFTEANFEKAKAAGATTDRIKSAYQLTPEMEVKYNSYVGSATTE